nr:hypothetical protein [Tanacetum cinerariifolium]
MAPLTFADTHYMVAFVSKSDASEATIKKVNDVVQLRALINGKNVVISEVLIRRDLHLDDADGVECFLNEEIFAELARMGYEKPLLKLIFYKAFFSTQWKFLIHTLIQCLSAKRTAWNDFSCFMAFLVICLATGRKFNFSKYIFDSMVRNMDSPIKFLMYPHFLQVVMDNQVDDLTSHNTRYTSPALIQKTTLIETCASLSHKVAELEQDKHTQALEILKLKKREDVSKQGGEIEAIDADEEITLVDVETQKEVVTMDVEPQGRINQEEVNATSKGISVDESTVFNDAKIAQKLQPRISKKRMIWKELKCYKNSMMTKKKILIGMLLQKKFKKGILTISGTIKVSKRNQEYKKVQTLFKPDKDVEELKKKRVADETLLQESFKKLKAEEDSCSESTQEIPSNDPKEMSKKDVHNMFEIVPVS